MNEQFKVYASMPGKMFGPIRTLYNIPADMKEPVTVSVDFPVYHLEDRVGTCDELKLMHDRIVATLQIPKEILEQAENPWAAAHVMVRSQIVSREVKQLDMEYAIMQASLRTWNRMIDDIFFDRRQVREVMLEQRAIWNRAKRLRKRRRQVCRGGYR